MSKKHLNFITVKPNDDKPRQQTIGWMNDRMKRVSSYYYIVREKNKVKQGHHFHILAQIDNEKLPGSWFRKGMHTHVRPLAGKSNYMYPESLEEEIIMLTGKQEPTGQELRRAKEIAKAGNKLIVIRGKHKKEDKLLNIFNYMNKDKPETLYTDYIIQSKPKKTPL